jgi:hypothetical protein
MKHDMLLSLRGTGINGKPPCCNSRVPRQVRLQDSSGYPALYCANLLICIETHKSAQDEDRNS